MCMGGKGQNFPIVKFKNTIHDSFLKVHYYMLNAYLLNFIICRDVQCCDVWCRKDVNM